MDGDAICFFFFFYPSDIILSSHEHLSSPVFCVYVEWVIVSVTSDLWRDGAFLLVSHSVCMGKQALVCKNTFNVCLRGRQWGRKISEIFCLSNSIMCHKPVLNRNSFVITHILLHTSFSSHWWLFL